MPLKYEGKNIKFAKILRKNMTRQEKHLWYDFLSEYDPKFQRQKAIGNFIADFYCYRADLVIELDGAQHETEEGIEKDAIRTEYLESCGLTVIRIPNRCVDREFHTICCYIDELVKLKIGFRSC